MVLIGTSYTVYSQIAYNVTGDNSKVQASQITDLRCDGVVEYVYEYNGYKVGGGTTDWDISINNASNYNAHSGTAITPKKQYSNLLINVTNVQSDLY